jgi:hypothetical protein
MFKLFEPSEERVCGRGRLQAAPQLESLTSQLTVRPLALRFGVYPRSIAEGCRAKLIRNRGPN